MLRMSVRGLLPSQRRRPPGTSLWHVGRACAYNIEILPRLTGGMKSAGQNLSKRTRVGEGHFHLSTVYHQGPASEVTPLGTRFSHASYMHHAQNKLARTDARHKGGDCG